MPLYDVYLDDEYVETLDAVDEQDAWADVHEAASDTERLELKTRYTLVEVEDE